MKRRAIAVYAATILYIAGVFVGDMFPLAEDNFRLVCGLALQGIALMLLIMKA